MAIKYNSLIQRFIIFQFIFLFIFSKVKNLQKSLIDFSKRIKLIAKYNNVPQDTIELIGSKSHYFFIILFSTYFICGILAILDYNFAKRIGGMCTIFMALIYCNPITSIKKNIEKNRYETKRWKLFIPSLEFCLIAVLGIIMILSSYYSTQDENEEKQEEIKKEKKVNNKDIKKKEKVN